ncbi:penicillin-binding protein [uncultured Prevotella sp.]|uniref:penicillin-binding protein n=1 Tax=uncultured Prevotella sp. TaxID=159272 RepID=UPI0025938888|nr:penicillin-binding protein [uncultured Prevotella sp.]
MSSKFNDKKIIPRYGLLSFFITIGAIAVVAKAFYIMTGERDYWMAVASRQKKDSVQVKPVRGNILSCDGQLMASSLPEFKIYMDFNTLKTTGNDSLWNVKLDSIAQGLNRIFPSKSAAQFKADLTEGHNKCSKHWPIWDERIDYSTFTEVKDLPVFRLPKFKSGFHWEEFNARRRPFGSLAQRTVGDMFGAKDTARCGLELKYDSILRGTNGIIHRRKVRSKYLNITDTPPVDGADIVTTIDVQMQDIAERAVINELKEIDGKVGVAIVMDVKTGDVKAIVNMEKCFDGQYREIHNHAVSDLMEPGSVFKTASIMAVLNDGLCDTTEYVETGGGVWNMYGRDMKDHNWRRGGYGGMYLPKTLLVSSNIGVSRIIDKYYHDNPERYVQDLHNFGLTDDLHIPIPGYSPARIRFPKKNKNGQYVNWTKTTLPWMSIGYETQCPPISILTFYNAIANNGCMMRPRFVKEIVKDGQVIADYPPVVQRKQIAKPEVIKKLQIILEHVVSQGLGKKAGSDKFLVAGKTGTAQMSKGALGYKTGGTDYYLSFAGYFPANEPRYSCIVCIQKHGLPASGGGMSGVVFHNIAEGIMAQSLKLEAADARDTIGPFLPEVYNGNLHAADYVLSLLGFSVNNGWGGAFPSGDPVWGFVDENTGRLQIQREKVVPANEVPDVHGMGARDAVYIMESRGIKVILDGRGSVLQQSIGAGEPIRRGMVCRLKLG